MSNHSSSKPDFYQTLDHAWSSSRSMLCVGLDPDPERFPALFEKTPQGIESFCCAIVDATAQYACAFKPQIAYFAAHRAEAALENVIAHIHRVSPKTPVILDAKRGDIGATATQYAVEAFERYNADAVTLSPYMGTDSIEPYFAYPDKGLFLLCRTSNPGGNDLQFIQTEKGQAIFERVAELSSAQWNPHGQMGLVVGATYPQELSTVRRIVGDMPLLVPGIGAQGGDIQATVHAGLSSTGFGLLINSSRAILYASQNNDFEEAAARVAKETRDAIAQAAQNVPR